MWGEIVYTFPNLNGVNVEVCEWISYFTPQFIIDMITHASCDQGQSMLVKRIPNFAFLFFKEIIALTTKPYLHVSKCHQIVAKLRVSTKWYSVKKLEFGIFFLVLKLLSDAIALLIQLGSGALFHIERLRKRIFHDYHMKNGITGGKYRGVSISSLAKALGPYASTC